MSGAVESGVVAADQGSKTSAADSLKCSALNRRAGQELHHRTSAVCDDRSPGVVEVRAARQFQHGAVRGFNEPRIGQRRWVKLQHASGGRCVRVNDTAGFVDDG